MQTYDNCIKILQSEKNIYEALINKEKNVKRFLQLLLNYDEQIQENDKLYE